MPAKREKNITERERPSEVLGLPEDVAAIRTEIRKFFASKDSSAKRIGSYKHGVYAFYDYDGEPIYVGQTEEHWLRYHPDQNGFGEPSPNARREDWQVESRLKVAAIVGMLTASSIFRIFGPLSIDSDLS